MADVFISYAREDRAFVRHLFDALEAEGRDAWVDWEDIPPTADWLEEVYAAIEAADTFVFVVSPDSVASRVCNLEIARAIKHNKRLVPVIRYEVDKTTAFEALVGCDWEALAQDNWQALKRPNWLFFRETDDFDNAFQALVEAIETDLDWVRAHTRLLVRAIEWDSKGRDNSFLLGGRDLREAEDWLAQGAAKEPRPTPLHVEYTTASRRAATRRQRVIFGAVTFGLIVAVVLALLAWGQRNAALDAQATAEAEANARATSQAQAELERDRAEYQSRLATSRQLAAQSWAVLEEYPQRSLLLAIEALKVTMRASELRVPAAEEALRKALGNVGGHGLSGHSLVRYKKGISDVAVSPDGHWLVTGSNDTTARLWDLTAPDPAAAPIVLRGHEDYIYAVAISPPSPGVFVSGMASILDVAISPDGHWLATCGGGIAQLWDLTAADPAANPIVFRDREGGNTVASSVAFGPDGNWLVTVGEEDIVWLWDLTVPDPTAHPIGLRGHEDNITALAFSPDGHWLVTGSADKTARLWNLTSPDPAADSVVLRSHESAIQSVAISPDNRWLVTGGGGFSVDPGDSTVRLWHLQLDDLIDLACRTAGRNLTRSEWGQYFPGELYRPTCPNLPVPEK